MLLLLLEVPPKPTSGNLLRAVLLLFLLLIYSLRLYILGIIYPWQFVILIVPVLISVHYRFGLQRKVLGRIRVDLLFFTGFIIALLLMAVHGIAKCVSDSSHRDSNAVFANAVFVIWDMAKTILSFMTLLSIFVFFWSNSLSKALKHLISKFS